MAQYIDPKIDFAFKKIFGSIGSEEILVSFLNAMLYDGETRILDVEIQNPYLPGESFQMKETYVDLKATLDDGAKVIIEMQMAHVSAFGRRLMYNSGKMFVSQLEVGRFYDALMPTYALAITNFNFIPAAEGPMSHFRLQEVTAGFDFPEADFLQYRILELPKFRKALTELETLQDRWGYFLAHASEHSEVPAQMKDDKAVEKAFEIADKATMSPFELLELDQRSRYVHQEAKEREYAQQAGHAEGRQAGLQQGLQQGLQEGLQQGLLQALTIQFGDLDADIVDRIRKIEDAERLLALSAAAIQVESLEEFLIELG